MVRLFYRRTNFLNWKAGSASSHKTWVVSPLQGRLHDLIEATLVRRFEVRELDGSNVHEVCFAWCGWFVLFEQVFPCAKWFAKLSTSGALPGSRFANFLSVPNLRTSMFSAVRQVREPTRTLPESPTKRPKARRSEALAWSSGL